MHCTKNVDQFVALGCFLRFCRLGISLTHYTFAFSILFFHVNVVSKDNKCPIGSAINSRVINMSREVFRPAVFAGGILFSKGFHRSVVSDIVVDLNCPNH